MKPKLNPALTPGSARVLRLMIDEDEELVQEGREVWVGLHQTSPRIVFILLRECLVRDVSDQNGGCQRYEATTDAKLALENPKYETRWREYLRTGQPVVR